MLNFPLFVGIPDDIEQTVKLFSELEQTSKNRDKLDTVIKAVQNAKTEEELKIAISLLVPSIKQQDINFDFISPREIQRNLLKWLEIKKSNSENYEVEFMK